MTTSQFAMLLSLIGVVILVAALLSGVIDRSWVPQVAVFLAIGAVIGPTGLNLVDIRLESPALKVVGMLSLALVLFTEALTLNLREARKHLKLASIILGPGTLASAALIAGAGMLLLNLSWPLALMLGAALASTDPVLLRALLRWRGLPRDTRLALRLESGLNDIVLLPVLFVAMTAAHAAGSTAGDSANFGRMFLQLFVMGPGAGVFVGLAAVSTMVMIRKHAGVRRDYESLYSLGVCFVAFGAGEALHASGYVAAFAAGLTISMLDLELCDCFLEYGETTAELAMLFAFVLLGTSLIWEGMSQATLPMILFAVLALAARPLTASLALWRTKMEPRSKRLTAWFGPRGLSSLLLILVPVFEKIPGTEKLFTVSCLVVLISVVLHGGSTMWMGRASRSEEPESRKELVELPVRPAGGPMVPEAITLAQFDLVTLQDPGVVLADVRTARGYDHAEIQAQHAVRIDPEDPVRSAKDLGLPMDSAIVSYCACPSEETSGRVTSRLRKAGYSRATALIGGWDAWLQEHRPAEAIRSASQSQLGTKQ